MDEDGLIPNLPHEKEFFFTRTSVASVFTTLQTTATFCCIHHLYACMRLGSQWLARSHTAAAKNRSFGVRCRLLQRICASHIICTAMLHLQQPLAFHTHHHTPPCTHIAAVHHTHLPSAVTSYSYSNGSYTAAAAAAYGRRRSTAEALLYRYV